LSESAEAVKYKTFVPNSLGRHANQKATRWNAAANSSRVRRESEYNVADYFFCDYVPANQRKEI